VKTGRTQRKKALEKESEGGKIFTEKPLMERKLNVGKLGATDFVAAKGKWRPPLGRKAL